MRRYRRSIRRHRRLARRSRGGHSMWQYRRSMRRHRRSARRRSRGVTGDIGAELPSYWCGVNGDCGVGITPQMCNRVTNHGDMGIFSKPAHAPFGRNADFWHNSVSHLRSCSFSSGSAHLQKTDPNSVPSNRVNNSLAIELDHWTISEAPFGICLPGTELLQSPFWKEFSMGSLLRQYRRSLRHYRQFLRSYCQSLRHYCGSLRRSAAARSEMPIFTQLTKHRKT